MSTRLIWDPVNAAFGEWVQDSPGTQSMWYSVIGCKTQPIRYLVNTVLNGCRSVLNRCHPAPNHFGTQQIRYLVNTVLNQCRSVLNRCHLVFNRCRSVLNRFHPAPNQTGTRPIWYSRGSGTQSVSFGTRSVLKQYRSVPNQCGIRSIPIGTRVHHECVMIPSGYSSSGVDTRSRLRAWSRSKIETPRGTPCPTEHIT
jgi:hypothetical protein